jgi:flagella basal body P-ring formation protein FlgA
VVILWIAAFVLGVTVLTVKVFHVAGDHVTSTTPTRVLIARRLISRGTPGSVIVSRKLYAKTRLPRYEVVRDALSKPQDLVGRVASRPLLPGHQLSRLDFSAK